MASLFFSWALVRIVAVVALLYYMPGQDSGVEYLTRQAERLVEDWTTPLMKKITVVDLSQGCPDGWTPLFANEWPGM